MYNNYNYMQQQQQQPAQSAESSDEQWRSFPPPLTSNPSFATAAADEHDHLELVEDLSIEDFLQEEEDYDDPYNINDAEAVFTTQNLHQLEATPAAGEGSRELLEGEEVVMRRRDESRFAFRTRSEVDILDDGFKWRKYGKKMVKNRPNPRNYYKCSVKGCEVKKRVERDGDDPNYVITTYHGHHTH